MMSSGQLRTLTELAQWGLLRGIEEPLKRLMSAADVEWPRQSAWPVPMDISESEHAYRVDVDLPGVLREDIELTVKGNELVVRGVRHETAPVDDGAFRQQERFTGPFERTITAPAGVQSDKITAVLEHGVLHITLPKLETAPPRHIHVEVQ